ncbi:AraC family transcriptional regulator [Flagellimonas meishanensis]|uniref:AraC family transcriptional regulator n=1 Tax=Flagellimonas meishanensis TaxID=2873264 RepID=UPI001CA6C8A3|nr:AraC family transcriptional regulator [[Muricauda] meishanensis]
MKVYPFKIPKTANDALIVQEDVEEEFYNKLHQHEEIQLSCILKGTGTLIVGDAIKRYRPGDVFVFGNNLPHVFKSDLKGQGKSHMLSIFFVKANFGGQLFQINELVSLNGFFAQVNSGFKLTAPTQKHVRFFLKIRDCIGINRFVLFFELLSCLTKEPKTQLSSNDYKTRLRDIEGQRMGKVFDYMFSHFQEQISLKAIADVASMTPTAFCRFFKLHTRKTYTQFLQELRLEHACKLLETHSDKIMVSDIAFQCGFGSVSNFNRFFKKTKGMSPLHYKNSKRVRF